MSKVYGIGDHLFFPIASCTTRHLPYICNLQNPREGVSCTGAQGKRIEDRRQLPPRDAFLSLLLLLLLLCLSLPGSSTLGTALVAYVCSWEDTLQCSKDIPRLTLIDARGQVELAQQMTKQGKVQAAQRSLLGVRGESPAQLAGSCRAGEGGRRCGDNLVQADWST